MEITGIYINIKEQLVFTFIITATILFFSFNCLKQSDDKDDTLEEIMLVFSGIGLFLIPFLCYVAHQNIITNEYTIYYNQGTLKQTMTTQEIVDVIMSKGVYDEPSGNTSTITITLPKENGDNYDAFYEHIMAMEENTSRQKRKQQRQKQEKQQNELKQKYLNETHQVDMKK